MRKILNILICIISSTLIIEKVKSWNLTEIKLNSSEIIVKHVTIIKNKAYLSIPRQSDLQNATLVTAPWPENTSGAINVLKIFPNEESQEIGNCSNLQSVISTDSDNAGRLFILDDGFEHCPPKIVVYDVTLHRVVAVSVLNGVSNKSLNSIVVDPLGVGGPRAYIGDTINEGLIIYCFREHHWWFIKLSPPPDMVEYTPEEKRIIPQQLTMAKIKPILYITSDRTNSLFSINAALLRVLTVPPAGIRENITNQITKYHVKLEGEKIGPSKGLACDKKGGLYYYIPRHSVLVRWDSHNGIIAENHEILMQSETVLPNIEQIFLDTHYHVWMLLGLPNNEGDYCIQLQKSNTIS